MHPKYIEHRESDRTMDRVNEWFNSCEKIALPYITVATRRKFGDVRWDHISFPRNVDNKIDILGDDFVAVMVKIFKMHANKKINLCYKLAHSVHQEYRDISSTRLSSSSVRPHRHQPQN
jgi:hypothetical protein